MANATPRTGRPRAASSRSTPTPQTGSILPSVGVQADGDFVVVWTSYGSPGTDPSSSSVRGQRYASNGSTQGGEFQVNSYTTGFQEYASVSATAAGDFVVTWSSNGSFGTDSSYNSVQAQRYASNGSTQGGEFQVNTYTTGSQSIPSVAADADGDFVVAWASYGSAGTDSEYTSVQGQRYASNGSPQGAQFQVNTYTASRQRFPSVGVAPDGFFVVAWQNDAYLDGGGDDAQGPILLGQSNYGEIQGQRYRVPPTSVPALSPGSAAATALLLVLAAGFALRRRG